MECEGCGVELLMHQLRGWGPEFCHDCRLAEHVREYGRQYNHAKREKRRAANRRYHRANRAKRLAAQRQYYQRNKDHLKQKARTHYRRNREQILKRKARWRVENPGKAAAYTRAYRQRPEVRERCRASNRKCAQRKRNQVIAALGGACAHCGIDDTALLQIHHVHGGGTAHRRKFPANHTYYNHVLQHVGAGDFALLCANCNWAEGSIQSA